MTNLERLTGSWSSALTGVIISYSLDKTRKSIEILEEEIQRLQASIDKIGNNINSIEQKIKNSNQSVSSKINLQSIETIEIPKKSVGELETKEIPEESIAELEKNVKDIQSSINDMWQKIMDLNQSVSNKINPQSIEIIEEPKPKESPEKSLAKISSIFTSSKEKLEDVKNKLNNKWEDFNQSFDDRIDKLMNLTIFDSLSKDIKFTYNGDGVSKFLEVNIPSDKLDKSDLNALTILAGVLSGNKKNNDALNKADDLCKYIILQSPEMLDVYQILYKIYEYLGNNKKKNINYNKKKIDVYQILYKIYEYLGNNKKKNINYNKKKIDCKKIINYSIKQWLYHDPFRYLSWEFAQYSFDDEDKDINKIDPQIEDTIYYHFNVGKFKYNSAKNLKGEDKGKALDDSLSSLKNSLKKAIELDKQENGDRKEKYERQMQLALHEQGKFYYSKNDYPKAIEKYNDAINLQSFRDPVIYSNLALACEYLRQPGKRADALSKSISALKEAMEINPNETSYATRLKENERLLDMIRKYGEPQYNNTLEPTSIRVEIHSNLKPYILSNDNVNLSDKLTKLLDEELRLYFKQKFSIMIPGIRFREVIDQGFQPGEYRFKIMETEVGRGSVQTDKLFFPGTKAELQQNLKILGDKGNDSLTGLHGYRINKEDEKRSHNRSLGKL